MSEEPASDQFRSPLQVTRGADSVVVTLNPPIVKNNVPDLCRRLHDTLTAGERGVGGGDGSGDGRILCDVSGLAADFTTIELLTRLALTAKRLGHHLTLHEPSAKLRFLLLLTGLTEILPEET
ncbi:STAS domain-containing protein [Actinomadura fulvescens]|uniref:STAS domain-containing protein n=1 Tax=Actinomadura fulvescens TaxID=46160 RepID=A0ABP6C2U4_9ACTN